MMPKGNPTPPEIMKAMAEAYRDYETATLKEVGDRFGKTANTVRKACRIHGVEIKTENIARAAKTRVKVHRHQKALTDDQEREAAEMFADWAIPTREILAKYKISGSTLTRIRKDHGKPDRPNNLHKVSRSRCTPKKTKVRRVAPARIPAEVLRLKHEEEYSEGEIAETLMITVTAVWGILWQRHPENPRRLDFVFPGGVDGMEVRA